jgi:hypothetical protein
MDLGGHMTLSQRIKVLVEALQAHKFVPQLISDRYVAGFGKPPEIEAITELEAAAEKAHALIYFDNGTSDHTVVMFVMKVML